MHGADAVRVASPNMLLNLLQMSALLASQPGVWLGQPVWLRQLWSFLWVAIVTIVGPTAGCQANHSDVAAWLLNTLLQMLRCEQC